MYEEHGHKFSSDESFNVAYRKVKRIKGFYSHLKVYIIVNIIIIVSNLLIDNLFNFEQYGAAWVEFIIKVVAVSFFFFAKIA